MMNVRTSANSAGPRSVCHRRIKPTLLVAGSLLALSVPAVSRAVTQVPLSSLNGSNGMAMAGVGTDDYTGFSISGIGDFDGDGFGDFIVGADGFDPVGRDNAGAAFVVFGVPSGFPANLPLANLNGTNGFRIIGQATDDYAGIAVNGAGDFNGDGFDDLIVGAHRNDPGFENAGAAYVIFGSSTHPSAVLDVGSMPATRGIKISGQGTGDRMGSYVSGAGDFNGDGFDDIILSANLASVGAKVLAGKAYLVFGKASPASFFVNDMTPSQGIILTGKAARDEAGWTASGLGDINGDGLDDIAVSAIRADPDSLLTAGEVYIVYGSRTNSSLTLPLENLNGTNGFTIRGDELDGALGFVVAAGGDVNGDGFNDILVAKSFPRSGSTGFPPVAKKYVIYGRAAAFPSSLSISALTNSERTILDGTESDPLAGQLLASAGDVNADGFFDILLGVPLRNSNPLIPGEAYLIYGKAGLGGSVSVPTLPDADCVRYVGVDTEDFTGGAVSSAGDVNGDGADDLLIGALLADPISADDDAGRAFLVLGTPNNNSVTYKTFMASNNSPKKGVGLIGDGSAPRPASRAWIDYAAGTGSGPGGSSFETVQLLHDISSINGGTFAPPTVWRLTSTRTGFGTFSVTLHYKDSEVSAFNEDDLIVFRADSPTGVWELLNPTARDKSKNLITVNSTKHGYFAVASAAAGNEIVLGDVNLDDVFDAADLVQYRLLLGTPPGAITPEVLIRGDVHPAGSGDGQITVNDLNTASQMMLTQ